jgi:hypothetical protein
MFAPTPLAQTFPGHFPKSNSCQRDIRSERSTAIRVPNAFQKPGKIVTSQQGPENEGQTIKFESTKGDDAVTERASTHEDQGEVRTLEDGTVSVRPANAMFFMDDVGGF